MFPMFTLLLAFVGCQGEQTAELRDPLLQPFSPESIWNMPIGEGAEYVAAELIVPQSGMVTIDEDYIFMTPDEEDIDLLYSDGGWQQNIERRCVSTDEKKFLAKLPMPSDFIVSPETWDGRSPNAGIAVLLKDKRHIYQGQPYAHCTEDGEYTVGYELNFNKEHPLGYEDLYGEGISGAHGASGLSALGGAIRVHELTPTSGPIQHALKINLYAALNLYIDRTNNCGHRWPARSEDSYASRDAAGKGYYTLRPSNLPVVKDCVMGSLFALKPDFDIEALRTEPAKVLAQTFMDYGAYVVDDCAWDVFGIAVEWGPNGRFVDEFKKNWGFKFTDYAKGADSSQWSDWAKDIRDIYSNLNVVANNSKESVGGPGKRRVPMAAPLGIIE